jgi:hypothetical protein
LTGTAKLSIGSGDASEIDARGRFGELARDDSGIARSRFRTLAMRRDDSH